MVRDTECDRVQPQFGEALGGPVANAYEIGIRIKGAEVRKRAEKPLVVLHRMQPPHMSDHVCMPRNAPLRARGQARVGVGSKLR